MSHTADSLLKIIHQEQMRIKVSLCGLVSVVIKKGDTEAASAFTFCKGHQSGSFLRKGIGGTKACIHYEGSNLLSILTNQLLWNNYWLIRSIKYVTGFIHEDDVVIPVLLNHWIILKTLICLKRLALLGMSIYHKNFLNFFLGKSLRENRNA